MDKEREYECTVSFTYNAADPVDAVAQFMSNLANAGWFVSVRDTDTGEKFVVDTDDMTISDWLGGAE
jgi:hypothetical protein